MGDNITIKDIAAKAGVGIGTVSRVLNNSPNVKDSTRSEVLRIAKELNYVPNGAARMLVRQSHSSATVGLLLPVVENQFFFELIKYIHSCLKEQQFNIMIFSTDHGHDSVVHHIVEQRLTAVLTLGDPPLTASEQEILNFHKIPFLYVDYHDAESSFITYDSVKGSVLAADYLISRQCKKIMMIGLTDRSQQQLDRFDGFRKRAEEVGGIQVSELCINSEEECCDISLSLMNDKSLDGIFYFSDTLAYGGIQARMECGRKVSIIGYDDIFPSKYMKLSTVKQSSEILGTRAAEMVIEMVRQREDGEEKKLLQAILEPQLIDRDS
ncbi:MULTISPECIES: LacI family DNA-binding transcriptional regulator [unclassified Oceanispirochaeta]|uniref:LacI family DNA-binding transcriptional regulator n=1 Tax=unclassified Oceanispirochaeta TaxID=2635722 RepID=UPI000E09866B|nr:LacI family DNA-binding transcriptional regulator [Oceanispirochaeta sp. M1]MBF9018987.1 LacI family DNA-binding transcriptional regulator [Oceanispirochaeta sp. M2]NPD75487.1 LacI family transcriptional regulator [Oceanispirochaeta sp. M1]RDG28665.1 LacI family transcriptional regulator [Oceanispirochaeta sp. M1]